MLPRRPAPQPKNRSVNPPQAPRRTLSTTVQSPSYEGPTTYLPMGYFVPYGAAPADQPTGGSPAAAADRARSPAAAAFPSLQLPSFLKPPATPTFLGPAPLYAAPALAVDSRYVPAVESIPAQTLNRALVELLSRAAVAAGEDCKMKTKAPEAERGHGCCRAIFFLATVALALVVGSAFSFYVVSRQLSERDLSFLNFTPFAVNRDEKRVAALPKTEFSHPASLLPAAVDAGSANARQGNKVFYFNPGVSAPAEETEPAPKYTGAQIPRCRTTFCRSMTEHFKSALNWTLPPCGDFYEFVCSSWRTQKAEVFSQDSLYAEGVENVLKTALLEPSDEASQLYKAADDKPVLGENSSSRLDYVRELVELCMHDRSNKSDTEKQEDQWTHLRSLLTTVGLESWPYQNDTASRADLWRTVVLLYRHLGLTTLVAVSVERDPENDTALVISVDEPDIAIGLFGTKDTNLPSWYPNLVRGTMKTFSPYKYLNQADKVLAFSEKLAEITSTRGERNYVQEAKLTTVHNLPSYAQFLGLLFGDVTSVNDKTRLLVKNIRYLKALRTLVHVTQNHDLLNYLGFRAVLHISPLMFGEEFVDLASVRMRQLTGNKKLRWPRWKTCLRMLEDAVPFVYQRAFFRATNRLLNIERVTALLNDLKSTVLLAVSNFTWMDAVDKMHARNILADVNLEVFYPSWIREDSGEASSALLPAAPPDGTRAELLSVYSHFVRSNTERRLLSIAGGGFPAAYPEWKGSIFSTFPKFDYETRSVYVPVALFNFSIPDTDAGLLFQTPRIATRVMAALIAALHRNSYPHPELPRMPNTTAGLASVTTCLESQYRTVSNNLHDQKIRSVVTTTYDFLDNAAVGLAVAQFSKYVAESGVAVQRDMLNLPLNSKQLFHVLYTADLCEGGSSEQLRQEFAEDARTPPRLRVVVPLRNTPSFAHAWSCSLEDAMNPAEKCKLLV
ncbi:hypothetical protein HPB48_024415 [Haemaphysalis longicornis]|uniref:Uncharacterized protein n=1 Tax=Haemaphysalis longicornis TaxID=44386 RepID=A0A9J6GY07_HAELO|nr:hypothetical protein HPB48_024415 [Haemaphysalis longicornis]